MGCLLRPPPALPLGGVDRNVTTQVTPDGPVGHGRCSHCGNEFESDIYRFRGDILCGDCRYYVRHGRWPNYDRLPRASWLSSEEAVALHEQDRHLRKGA